MLLSLIIVGVVAIITVPVLINNVQKKLFATQVKNFAAQIEQLAQDELITHRTRDLSNTDFADPELLLSDKHFEIVKSCSASTSLTDCWKTKASGKDKINYKLLNGNATLTNSRLNKTIVLKNGIMFAYYYAPTQYRSGYFIVDINGNDKPNIGGRDLFTIFLSPKGKTIGGVEAFNNINVVNPKNKAYCYRNYDYCYDYLLINNWKMDY